ncbi:large tegument protein [Testudinid alphaherpesvirus 3]|uniref:Large tegument protein n=1 Tax=Testudinid alphaherpesvirus 3 TaxID=2560801 RepID=A0A0M3LCS4_9ALPH|nr:large tegument protein [Testudinid alphaherpesvirus 3]AIU39239.1 large tegument protein [Testudinid alphaherpesvirus 3]
MADGRPALSGEWGELLAYSRVNQGDPVFGSNSGVQCVINSVVFLRSIYLYGLKSVLSREAITTILHQGSAIFTAVSTDGRYLLCDEIPLFISTGGITTIGAISKSYGNMPIIGDSGALGVEGLVMANGYEFVEIIKSRSAHPLDYIVAIIGKSAIALYRDNDFVFIFEPHGYKDSGAFVSRIYLNQLYSFLLSYGSESQYNAVFVYFALTKTDNPEAYPLHMLRNYITEKYGAVDAVPELQRNIQVRIALQLQQPKTKRTLDEYIQRAVRLQQGKRKTNLPLLVSNEALDDITRSSSRNRAKSSRREASGPKTHDMESTTAPSSTIKSPTQSDYTMESSTPRGRKRTDPISPSTPSAIPRSKLKESPKDAPIKHPRSDEPTSPPAKIVPRIPHDTDAEKVTTPPVRLPTKDKKGKSKQSIVQPPSTLGPETPTNQTQKLRKTSPGHASTPLIKAKEPSQSPVVYPVPVPTKPSSEAPDDKPIKVKRHPPPPQVVHPPPPPQVVHPPPPPQVVHPPPPPQVVHPPPPPQVVHPPPPPQVVHPPPPPQVVHPPPPPQVVDAPLVPRPIPAANIIAPLDSDGEIANTISRWGRLDVSPRLNSLSDSVRRQTDKLSALPVLTSKSKLSNIDDDMASATARRLVNQAVCFMIENGICTIRDTESPMVDVIRAINNMDGIKNNYPNMVDFLTNTELHMDSINEHAHKLGQLKDDTNESGHVLYSKVNTVMKKLLDRTENFLADMKKNTIMNPSIPPKERIDTFKHGLEPYVSGHTNLLYMADTPSGVNVMDFVSGTSRALSDARNQEEDIIRAMVMIITEIINTAAAAVSGNGGFIPVLLDRFPTQLPHDMSQIFRLNDNFKQLISLVKDRTRHHLTKYDAIIKYSITASKNNNSKFTLSRSMYDPLYEYVRNLTAIDLQFQQLQQLCHNQIQFIPFTGLPEVVVLMGLMQVDVNIDDQAGLEFWIERIYQAGTDGFLPNQAKNIADIRAINAAYTESVISEQTLSKISDDMQTTRGILANYDGDYDTAKNALRAMLASVNSEKDKITTPETKNTLAGYEKELQSQLTHIEKEAQQKKAEEDQLLSRLRGMLKPTTNFSGLLSSRDVLSDMRRARKDPEAILVAHPDIRNSLALDIEELIITYGRFARKWTTEPIEGLSRPFVEMINFLQLQNDLHGEMVFFNDFADEFVVLLIAVTDSPSETILQTLIDKISAIIPSITSIADGADKSNRLSFLDDVLDKARNKLDAIRKAKRKEEIDSTLDRLISETGDIQNQLKAYPSKDLYNDAFKKLTEVEDAIGDLNMTEDERLAADKKLGNLKKRETDITKGYNDWETKVQLELANSEFEAYAANVKSVLAQSVEYKTFPVSEYSKIEQNAPIFRSHSGFAALAQPANKMIDTNTSVILNNVRRFFEFNPYKPGNSPENIPIPLMTDIQWARDMNIILPHLSGAFGVAVMKAKEVISLYSMIFETLNRSGNRINYYDVIHQYQHSLRTLDELKTLVPFYLTSYREFVAARQTFQQIEADVLDARNKIDHLGDNIIQQAHEVVTKDQAIAKMTEIKKTKYENDKIATMKVALMNIEPKVFQGTAYFEYVTQTLAAVENLIKLLEGDSNKVIAEKVTTAIQHLQNIIDEHTDRDRAAEMALAELKRKLLIDAPASIKKALQEAISYEELVGLWTNQLKDLETKKGLRANQLKPLVEWLEATYVPLEQYKLKDSSKPCPMIGHQSRLNALATRVNNAMLLDNEIQALVSTAGDKFEALKLAFKEAELGPNEHSNAVAAVTEALAAITTLIDITKSELYPLIETVTETKVQVAIDKKKDIMSIEAALTLTGRGISEADSFFKNAPSLFSYRDIRAGLKRATDLLGETGLLPKWKKAEFKPYIALLNLRSNFYQAYGNMNIITIDNIVVKYEPPKAETKFIDLRAAKYCSLNDKSVLDVRRHQSNYDTIGPVYLTSDSSVLEYTMCYPTVAEKLVDLTYINGDRLTDITTNSGDRTLSAELANILITSMIVTEYQENYTHGIISEGFVFYYTNYVNNKQWTEPIQNYTIVNMMLYTLIIHSVFLDEHATLLISSERGKLTIKQGNSKIISLTLKELISLLIMAFPHHIRYCASLSYVKQVEYIMKTLFPLIDLGAKTWVVGSLNTTQTKRGLPIDRTGARSNSMFGIIKNEWIKLPTPDTFQKLLEDWLKISNYNNVVKELIHRTNKGSGFQSLLFAIAFNCIPANILNLLWTGLRPVTQNEPYSLADYYHHRVLTGHKYLRTEATAIDIQTKQYDGLYHSDQSVITYTMQQKYTQLQINAFDMALFSIILGVPMVIGTLTKDPLGAGNIEFCRLLSDLRVGDKTFDIMLQSVDFSLEFMKQIGVDYNLIENACLTAQINPLVALLSHRGLKDISPALVLVDESNDVIDILMENTTIPELVFNIAPEQIADVRIPSNLNLNHFPDTVSPSDPLFANFINQPLAFDIPVDEILNIRPRYSDEREPEEVTIELESDSSAESEYESGVDQEDFDDADEFQSELPDDTKFIEWDMDFNSHPSPNLNESVILSLPVSPTEPRDRDDTYELYQDLLTNINQGGESMKFHALLKRSLQKLIDRFEDIRTYLQRKTNSLLLDIQRIKLMLD